jgi:hypothetical protein
MNSGLTQNTNVQGAGQSDPSTPMTLYVGTFGGKVFKSTTEPRLDGMNSGA